MNRLFLTYGTSCALIGHTLADRLSTPVSSVFNEPRQIRDFSDWVAAAEIAMRECNKVLMIAPWAEFKRDGWLQFLFGYSATRGTPSLWLLDADDQCSLPPGFKSSKWQYRFVEYAQIVDPNSITSRYLTRFAGVEQLGTQGAQLEAMDRAAGA